MQEPATITFGQKAVGIRFNPSHLTDVDIVKQHYATIIDFLHDLQQSATDGEKKRMYAVAITEAQTSQMWAVKAITWL